MDHFYAFLIFAGLLALELLAANTWLAAYFRIGIPVMFIRRRLEATAPADFSPAALAKALDKLFQAQPDHPSIHFKALRTRNPARAEIALHEALFESKAGFRYLPVTHALARLRLDRGEVVITGYVDWYVLFVLVYLVLNSLQDRSFIFIAIVVLIIFGVSFLFQRAVNRMAAERINGLLVEEANPPA